MVMGPAVPAGVAVLPPGLPPLVQAARTLAPSTATAPVANAFPRNQGCPGLTPGSSYLNRLQLYTAGYTGPNRHSCAEQPESQQQKLTPACGFSMVVPLAEAETGAGRLGQPGS